MYVCKSIPECFNNENQVTAVNKVFKKKTTDNLAGFDLTTGKLYIISTGEDDTTMYLDHATRAFSSKPD
jgi:hypothetical protein